MLETVSLVPDPRQVWILDFGLLLFPLRGLLLPSCLDHLMLPPVTRRMLLLRKVANHAEHLATFALDHRAALRSLDDHVALGTFPVVQLFQEILELPVVCREAGVDLRGGAGHLPMPRLAALRALFEFAKLAAEVILGVAGAHELAIIAIGGGAFDELSGVGPSVELEAELVESLHFRLI